MTVATLAHISIGRSRSAREVYPTNKTKRCLAGILITAILASGFLYVFLTNNIAARDYRIRELQEMVKELRATNTSLQIEVSNLKSFNILEMSSENSEMVKSEKVDYVSLPKSSAMLAR
jgi:hypothetical protein